jgi:hypothetical protein
VEVKAEEDCGFGCNEPLGTYHTNCPIHNPIDVEHFDKVMAQQEPIRDELRIANTTSAMRHRVATVGNGRKTTTPIDLGYRGSTGFR